nr:transposase [Succinivibrionaceae bacterium]
IPFYRMLNMLAYKCKRLGINFVLQEESYTSKCDALAFESIEKHENYKCSRIKRGLFKSSVGKLINADINGALNILRKFLNSTKGTSEFSVLQKIIGSGLVFRPVRITGNGIEAKL